MENAPCRTQITEGTADTQTDTDKHAQTNTNAHTDTTTQAHKYKQSHTHTQAHNAAIQTHAHTQPAPRRTKLHIIEADILSINIQQTVHLRTNQFSL